MDSIIIKGSWKEITLREVIEIGAVDIDPKMEGLSMGKRLKHLAAVSNWDMKQIEKLRGQALANSLNAIKYLSINPKRSRKKTFELKTDNEDLKHMEGEYMFYPDLTQLSAGEQVSIEVLIKDAHDNDLHVWPGILSILIRPVEEVNGKKVLEEFDAGDIADRKEFFMDSLMVPYFWQQVNFFFATEKTNKSTTK